MDAGVTIVRLAWLLLCAACAATQTQAALLGIPDDQLTPGSAPAPSVASPPARVIEPLPRPADPAPLSISPNGGSPASDRLLPPENYQTFPGQFTRRPDQQALQPKLDPEKATAKEFIAAAQAELRAGRFGVVTDLIEQAQTRLLDRSVRLGATYERIDDPAVQRLTQAKQALAGRDQKRGLELLDEALKVSP